MFSSFFTFILRIMLLSHILIQGETDLLKHDPGRACAGVGVASIGKNLGPLMQSPAWAILINSKNISIWVQ